MYFNANILNQLGSPSINSNTFANRPAAGQTGRLFVSTDTFELYRDNGTGWDLIGGPGSSTVTGSGAAGQVTYWTGTNSVGGNNNLFWDSANSRLGIGTATPGTKLDVHTTAGAALQLNSTNAVGNIYSDYQNQGTTQYRVGYTDDADINYRRFGIYDSIGAKETITIDQQSRYVGINYQYSSLADQPQYTLDVSGSTRATDSSFFVTSGTGQVGINTTSPTQATALIEAVKTDGYGLFLNYATSTGSGSTATALWALNTTASSGFAAVIEEKTANTTGGQYPLLIKHSLSSGTAAAGMGTGLHFQLPDNAGTFKTTQLTVETTDAAAATYTTRYRFMAQVNGTSTALAYLTSVGLGIGNVIPSYKLDVNGVARVFGAGNTGRFLAVDTNVSGASVELNPQYGTGLPILQSVGSFPLLFGTNNTENARFTTAGNLIIGTTEAAWSVRPAIQMPDAAYFVSSGGSVLFGSNVYFNGSTRTYITTATASDYRQVNGEHRWESAPSGTANTAIVMSQNMTLGANGNLLIGTTTDAGQKLQVSGTSYITSSTSIGTSSVVGGYIFSVLGTGGSGARTATFGGPDSATSTGSTGPVVTIYNSNTTANNIAKLAFAGFTTGEACSINGQITDQVNNYGQFIFTTRDSSGYADRMVLNSTGLGIGTNAPVSALEIAKSIPKLILTPTTYAGNYRTILGTRTGGEGILQFGNNNDNYIVAGNTGPGGYLKIYVNATSDFVAGTTGTQAMQINANANVLIGTTTDGGAKLAVNGSASINTTTNGQFSKLNVAGGIHFNNNTDAVVSNEGSYGNAFSVRTSVTGGVATTIKSNTGSEGAMYIVSGLFSNKRFCDIVIGLGSSITPVVISNTAEANSPATRTYSVSGENLQLTLSGSDTYTIYLTGFGANEKS